MLGKGRRYQLATKLGSLFHLFCAGTRLPRSLSELSMKSYATRTNIRRHPNVLDARSYYTFRTTSVRLLLVRVPPHCFFVIGRHQFSRTSREFRCTPMSGGLKFYHRGVIVESFIFSFSSFFRLLFLVVLGKPETE